MNRYIKTIILSLIFLMHYSYATTTDRVDLDFRYSSSSYSDFSSLLNKLSNMKSIEVNDKTYIIKYSNNEVFIDNYFDTISLTLLNRENSLRYRQRFVNSLPYSQVIQYKKRISDSESIQGSMWEYKMEIKDKVVNESDLLDIVVNQNNDKFQLIEKLSNDINTSKLKRIFTAFQNRDRLYLYDKSGIQTYTITFDKVYYSDKLNYVPYWVIEFEVNEKLLTKSNEDHKVVLISNLKTIINNIVDSDFYFVDDNKYTIGAKKLNLKKSNKEIGDYLTLLEIIGIIIAAWMIFAFRNKARNL